MENKNVFISYARNDARDFAGRLAAELKLYGFTPWLDTAENRGGAEWLQNLEQGIDTCSVFIAIQTPDAKKSKWVRRERLYALEKLKPIIPVLHLDCDADLELIDRQPVDFSHSFEQALPELLERIIQLTTGHPPEPQDRRTLEQAYLGRILLEHSIWQDLYTPMAGVAQMLVADPIPDTPAIETAATPMDTHFCAFLDEQAQSEDHPREHVTRQQSYTDILPAVDEMRQLVVLGDPGCGKTTTLWRIAADYAERATTDATAPLPVFVRLGQLSPEQSLEAQLIAQLGELGPHYHTLLSEKRLVLLLDGLNELPTQNRREKVQQIKQLIERCQREEMIAVVTCRELDFVGNLRLDIPQRVMIEPLDPIRIRTFVNNYIQQPPDAGDRLFWQLAGDTAKKRWPQFVRAVGDDPLTFWLADELPEGKEWWTWHSWRRERMHPRSMLTLAQTPYMLYMMTQVFTREGELPPNRGRLFQQFVDFLLLKREHLTLSVADVLQMRLAELAYHMQAQGKAWTSISREETLLFLEDDLMLYQAQSANILSGTDDIRFTHQLLQEFFAAHKLDAEMQAGTPATRFWPRDTWWEPQGWEETAILLAGLYNDDCTPVIEWLQDANPELAARCVLAGGAYTPDVTIQALQSRWIPRLTDVQREPQAPARAAIGRAAGRLKLDQRPGVIEIEWVEIPAGEFLMGSDKKKDPLARDNETPQHTVTLPTFYIACYPITYAQYAAFVHDEGYQKREYWTEAGWSDKGDRTQPRYWNDPRWHIVNHPVVEVTWYEAYAFTQWLNETLPAALIPQLLFPQVEGERYRELARQTMVQAARELRQRQTGAEVQLWQCLRDRRLGGVKFRRQHPVADTSFVVDFFNYESKLVIEVDGPIHARQGAADEARQRELENRGYHVLRFSNAQVYHDLETTLSTILHTCHTCSLLPEGEGLGMRANWEIRLPTEQEWEKAARGTEGLVYPYGNEFDATKGNTRKTNLGRASAVGLFPDGTSPYEVLDMSGNVWEWCLTKWRGSYEQPEDNDPAGDAARVLRGGSWRNSVDRARCAYRYIIYPYLWYNYVGFRVVCGRPPSL